MGVRKDMIDEWSGIFSFSDGTESDTKCDLCDEYYLIQSYVDIMKRLQSYIHTEKICCYCWNLLKRPRIKVTASDGWRTFRLNHTLYRRYEFKSMYDEKREELEKEFGELPFSVNATPKNLKAIYEVFK